MRSGFVLVRRARRTDRPLLLLCASSQRHLVGEFYKWMPKKDQLLLLI